jgi:hypothetical protein
MSVLKCDILVVGAGPAGISAAIAAAELDRRVVLVERYGVVGGAVTASLVNTICGLYYINAAKPVLACKGFVEQWALRMAEESGSSPVKMPGGLWVLPIDPCAFGAMADESICEHRNIELLVNTTASKVETDGRMITNVQAMSMGNVKDIQPDVVVDCSGQASVTHLAGGKTEDVSLSQSAAIVVKLGNVSKDMNTRANLLAFLREISRAVEAGVLPVGCNKISFTPSVDPGELYVKLALPVGKSKQCLSVVETETEIDPRAKYLAGKLTGWITKTSTAFKNSECSISVAPQAGIRASRRGIGKAVLTRENVLNCDKFADAAASGTWPIEVWDENGKCTTEMLPENSSYDIPAGCLISEDYDNLFMAGRCISADAGALASSRVIATAMATGYSAGQSAAEMAGDSN